MPRRVIKYGTREIAPRRAGLIRHFSVLVGLPVSEHDPEKWVLVFRKDHAPLKIQSAMTIQRAAIALWGFARYRSFL
jgi:hypothetical protein